MKTRSKFFLSVRTILMLCGLTPLIISSIFFMLFASDRFHTIMYEYRLMQLESVAIATEMNIETYGGIENAREYLDTLHSETGIEMTIINGATRAITTLKDANGNYITGTDIDHDILNVLKTGKSYIDMNVTITGREYLVSYFPIIVDGEYLGAVFTGYEKAVTRQEVLTVIYRFIVLSAIFCIIFTIINIILSNTTSKNVRNLVNNLNHMANGELNEVEETRQSIREFKDIDNALMTMHSKLTEVVGTVTDTASILDNITDTVAEDCTITTKAISDIGVASEEISHGTVSLASNATEMNSSLIDIGENINSIREKVEGVHESTSIALDTSINLVVNLGKLLEANSKTKEHTNEVVKSINETAEAIDKISSAATFIESIAAQTNLLSLNASIEAARAGDAGRGFAVVASEIKNLAEQSASSANDVQDIIKTIIEKSNQNTLSANEIASAVDSEMKLLHIVKDGVSDISEKVENVNNDMADVKNTTINIDQKTGVILDNISSLSSVSEENAAMSEETTATVTELGKTMNNIDIQSKEVANQSKSLLDTIKFFKI